MELSLLDAKSKRTIQILLRLQVIYQFSLTLDLSGNIPCRSAEALLQFCDIKVVCYDLGLYKVLFQGSLYIQSALRKYNFSCESRITDQA